mmetsp:Transcript_35896/g.55105  ORF Transcript_35896/g.55105 Transcript_35896/m.55105 type:complete len:141 (+) Transcript_35896:493-915(+)
MTEQVETAYVADMIRSLSVWHLVLGVLLFLAQQSESSSTSWGLVISIAKVFAVCANQVLILQCWYMLMRMSEEVMQGCPPFRYGLAKQWFILEIMAFMINIFMVILQLLFWTVAPIREEDRSRIKSEEDLTIQDLLEQRD